MAYDKLLEVSINMDASGTGYTNFFSGGMGTVIDVRMDVLNLTIPDETFQLVVMETDKDPYDPLLSDIFTDSIMTKVYDVSEVGDDGYILGEKFVFLKQKQYHMFRVILTGSAPTQAVVNLYQY